MAELRAASVQQLGEQIIINGQPVASRWAFSPGGGLAGSQEQLWLPLDFLVSRLGFVQSRVEAGDQLNWYGKTLPLASIATRTLDDEVSLNVAGWLAAAGVQRQIQGSTLRLHLNPPRLNGLRRGKGSMATRLVFDLSGPGFVQRVDNDLLLEIQSTAAQRTQLRHLGLGIPSDQGSNALRLKGQAESLASLTLNNPWRIVLDGVGKRSSPAPLRSPLLDASIQKLIRKGLVIDSKVVKVGVKPLRVFRVGTHPQSQGLRLQALAPTGSQQRLSFLNQLAQPSGALIAINGGFFNRVKQLPLGALRRDGIWLSGPILNRGAVGWGSTGALSFGRLRLKQELRDSDGQRWELDFLNSGYLRRGLSRYTRAWGPFYRALSGEEQALLISAGRVVRSYNSSELDRGVRLMPGRDLVIARGGAPLPAAIGANVSLQARPSIRLGEQPNVLGGGPLLLQNSKIVLAGAQEGFSPSFMALSAPRTVVGQGLGKTWLLTITGASGSDPTLLETALATQQLGLSDALNLDGGSSTSLLVRNQLVMTGRGTPPRVQNGLGLVPI